MFSPVATQAKKPEVPAKPVGKQQKPNAAQVAESVKRLRKYSFVLSVLSIKDTRKQSLQHIIVAIKTRGCLIPTTDIA